MEHTAKQLDAFTALVRERGRELYRDLPWRNTRDPYAVMLSEIMLQQTQVPRVMGRWEEWLDLFPTAAALAAAPLPPVLEAWQGMGYNRRAINLKRACEQIVERFDGEVPKLYDDLLSLPGVGPATAAGVRAFAFDEPGVYLETNVRTVFLHELFNERESVADKELIPLVRATCPEHDVRGWYYALLDYGAHLKKTMPNPSRRSKHHVKQSKFEGSHRQKRAFLLRRLLEAAATVEQLTDELSATEVAAGRDTLAAEDVQAILEELRAEGFAVYEGGTWRCAE